MLIFVFTNKLKSALFIDLLFVTLLQFGRKGKLPLFIHLLLMNI
jgi:hypothetical protein